MRYKIEVASIFEFGLRTDKQGNPHQEDCIFPAHAEYQPSDRLFILCDGMGGHDAGEVASATVCEAMSQSILGGENDPEGDFTQADFDKALDAAFLALDKKDTGAARKMGTTMTMLKLYNGGAFIAWMGDSRVYQIRPEEDGKGAKIMYHTEDHSLVNDLVKIGQLTEEEARTSPQRNIITRALQPCLPRRPRPGIKWIDDIKPGDFFYLCSDGMLEVTDDEMLCQTFAKASDIRDLVQTLIDETKDNRDNHSAFIIRIADIEPEGDETEKLPVDGEASQPQAESEDKAEAEAAPHESAIMTLFKRIFFK